MMWLVWVLVGLAVLFLLGCAALVAVNLRSVVHPHRHTVESMRAQQAEGGMLDAIERYETQWPRTPFTLACNGVTLSGEYIVAPADAGPRRRVVIISHGHTCNRYASLKYADLFLRAGFSVVLYDQRYFGESTGKCCTLGQEEALDLRSVIAYTRQVFGADCLLGLHGESMGAATVLLVLRWEKPDFVVADCPFASSFLLFRHILEDTMHLPRIHILYPLMDLLGGLLYNYRPGRVNPIEAVAGSDVPICFMHGDQDSLIPCQHSEMMFARCRDPRSVLHLFPGSDHAQSIHDHRADYEKKVLEFLQTCLPAE